MIWVLQLKERMHRHDVTNTCNAHQSNVAHI